MKAIKQLIVVIMIAIAFPAFAADEPAKTETKIEAKTDYKDAFLQLALEKSKLYSGKMEDAIGQGVEMAKKEVPELAKEWITWRFYYHLINACVPLVCLIMVMGWIVYWYKVNVKARWDDEPSHAIFIVSAIFGSAIFIGLSISIFSEDHLSKLIQIKVAPRIYMIEEVSKLIRK